MMNRILHGIFFLLFLTFALLQINDEGALPWIIGYGWAAALFAVKLIQAIRPPEPVFQWLLAGSVAGYLIWAALWFPEVRTWIELGMPSVTGSMSAETPYVEYVREFGGLLICAAATGYLTFLELKVRKRED
ncbi:MAG: hypothetical protein EA360_11180 [Balneolaceae bacterium]|nr:MAG: hypothetical protein EA360_11180 [Balneolaceae bacterium]